MIKKILDWILGKNETPQETAAPYKMEPPTLKEVVVPAQPAVEAVEQPKAEEVTPAPMPEAQPLPLVELGPEKAEVPVVETAPVTVKAKYKKAELNKKSKKELLDLAAQHGLAVKARSTKEELVKVLAKV